ncbi:MAG: ribosome recycling factor [Candidatus Brocadiia bacterium]
MPYDDIYLDASERMDKAVQHLKEQFRTVRSSRATPGLVENVRVEYYGTQTPLKQLASIGVPDPQLIVIKPYDPSSVDAVNKAILTSQLGLTPSVDGKLIRVTVPALSEERRKKLVSQLHSIAEEAKIAIRNIRRDANKQADQEKSDGTMPEDDAFRLKDDIQEMTNEHEKTIDQAVESKTQEIMEV